MSPEGGYWTFPYAVSRYDQTPGEVYGRGRALVALPTATALNVVDQFQVTNDFEGGLLGAQFLRTSGPWSLKGVAA